MKYPASIFLLILLLVSLSYSQDDEGIPIYCHIELSSGTVFGPNLSPNPYIPMLRIGGLRPLDPDQEETYLGGHAVVFWRNPGLGLQGDFSYHSHIKTIAQAVSCYGFPEIGYSYVFDPSDGGSIFLGGGFAFSTSYLIATIRASYFIRLDYTMLQVGVGAKI